MFYSLKIKEVEYITKTIAIIKIKSFRSKNHFKRKSAIHIATGSRGPNTRTPNPAGFYECITQHDKTVKVRSKSEFDKMITTNNWGFRGKTQESLSKNKFRVYPCYEDTKDLKTLKWLIVYYK